MRVPPCHCRSNARDGRLARSGVRGRRVLSSSPEHPAPHRPVQVALVQRTGGAQPWSETSPEPRPPNRHCTGRERGTVGEPAHRSSPRVFMPRVPELQ
jgi:hypothetical protein